MRKMIHKVTGVSSGFTLIELLIVIVIIGIMSGALIAVINPATQQRRARESVLRANTDKLCISMMGCSASRQDPLTSCYDGTWATFLTEIGANDPTGRPVGGTYAVANIDFAGAANANAISVTGTLGTCSYRCTYITTTGATTATAVSSGAGTCLAE